MRLPERRYSRNRAAEHVSKILAFSNNSHSINDKIVAIGKTGDHRSPLRVFISLKKINRPHFSAVCFVLFPAWYLCKLIIHQKEVFVAFLGDIAALNGIDYAAVAVFCVRAIAPTAITFESFKFGES